MTASTRREGAPIAPVRLAASLLLVRETTRGHEIWMGRRRPDAVFMPSRLVFPGGRVEAGDIATSEPGPPADWTRLADALPPTTPAMTTFGLLRAAHRELQEETGVAPPPGPLHLVGRAITPPNRVRRYDTWFFLQKLPANAALSTAGAPDGELLEIGWRDWDVAMAEDLHPVTRQVMTLTTPHLTALEPPPPLFIKISSHQIGLWPLGESPEEPPPAPIPA